MKTFDLTNTDDNGQMIIHLQGDNANYIGVIGMDRLHLFHQMQVIYKSN